jgi:hypothetical protein
VVHHLGHDVGAVNEGRADLRVSVATHKQH